MACALTAMAAFPNVYVKLSGLGMFSLGLDLSAGAPGDPRRHPDFRYRADIYGSNFPLEKLHASYEDFFAIYRKVLSEYSEAEQRAVLHDNAVKFYRICYQNPTALPCRSYSSARSILTVAISPTRNGRRLAT